MEAQPLERNKRIRLNNNVAKSYSMTYITLQGLRLVELKEPQGSLHTPRSTRGLSPSLSKPWSKGLHLYQHRNASPYSDIHVEHSSRGSR